jgi:hypothetical protein
MSTTSDQRRTLFSIINILRRWRHNFIFVPLSTRPLFFYPITRIYILLIGLRKKKGFGYHGTDLLVSKDTEIAIEGFPRSANTFAVEAFEMSQDHPVRIAHHLHASAQIMMAVKYGIPTVVLIREPKGALESCLVREPHRCAKGVLKDYIHFYNSIHLHSADYVVATFEQVTNNLGKVTRRVNTRFGTTLKEFAHTEKNVADCFQRIDDQDRKQSGKESVRTDFVCRPSEAKSSLKRQAAERLKATHLDKLWDRAREIYEEFSSYADASPDSSQPSANVDRE